MVLITSPELKPSAVDPLTVTALNKLNLFITYRNRFHSLNFYYQTLPSGKTTPLVKTKHPKGLASVVVTIQYAFFASS